MVSQINRYVWMHIFTNQMVQTDTELNRTPQFVMKNKLLKQNFNVPGYKAYRNDRNCSGGWIIAYVRSNLSARRRPDLELDLPIETIFLDVTISKRKWAIIGAYRPPSMDNKLFTDLIQRAWTIFQLNLITFY